MTPRDELADAPTEAASDQDAAPRSSTPAPGTVLAGRYRLLRPLGAGGMGSVFLADQLALDKPVAIKLIQERFGGDPAIARRFVQEARAASTIDHQHVVEILDFGELDDGALYLVMEYLDGEDLAQTLRRCGSLRWERVVHIGEAIAWALAAAHTRGIVHRDIKPANCVRVARPGDPDFIKVLDFGLAKVVADRPADERSLTHTGALIGTPGYIAPELYRGRKADHRVDLFAVGAVLFKLLTGELPQGRGDRARLAETGAPEALQAVIERALADDPEDRPATAEALAQALRAIPRVAADAPTQLAQVDADAPTQLPYPASPAPTASADATRPSDPAAPRELTPLSSLVTVERDGDRVRLSMGLPVLAILGVVVALLAGVLWTQLRAPPSTAPPTSAPLAAADAPPPALGDAKPEEVDAPPTSPANTDAATSTGDPRDGSESATTAAATADSSTADSSTAATDADPSTTTLSTLRRRIQRRCPQPMSTPTVVVSWQTDDAGAIAGKVRVKQVGERSASPVYRDCVAARPRDSDLRWPPNERLSLRVAGSR
ncbi:MAG: serine/threonine-protein kinase [Nannocystaceae bacterium]